MPNQANVQQVEQIRELFEGADVVLFWQIFRGLLLQR